ncbi:putative rhamnosyl transferase [Nitzschia inconspicua]|uniref:Rhamnosyl transferase n=1 Tax=Nitzschia inconspicua TaxID=303405 RepID=A0A9K3KTV3_9STRA|nr:putative rhamnosyl transferase [Nitzschia inconspicua]
MNSANTSRRRKSQQQQQATGGNDGNSRTTTTTVQPVTSKQQQRKHNGAVVAPAIQFTTALVSSGRMYSVYLVLFSLMMSWALIGFLVIHRSKGSNLHHPQKRVEESWWKDDLFFSLPCPTDTSNNGRIPDDTSIMDNDDEPFEILHAIITPFGGKRGQHIISSSLHQNGTLPKYRNNIMWNRARLQMMETFCAPTLRNQTSSNFVWIVIVDDTTLHDPNVVQRLNRLVQEHNNNNNNNQNKKNQNNATYGNAYLFQFHQQQSSTISLSPFLQSRESNHIGWDNIVTEYSQGHLEILLGDQVSWDQIMGKISASIMSKSAPNNIDNHRKESSKPLLLLMETTLHTDSGLDRRGVEWMRIIASRHADKLLQVANNHLPSSYLRSIFLPPPVPPEFIWYMCGSSSIEWHNPDILWTKRNIYNEQGISVGRVGRRDGITSGCPPSGMTRARILTTSKPILLSGEKDVVTAASAHQRFPSLQDLPPCQAAVTAVSTECMLRASYPSPIVVTGISIASDSVENPSIENFKYMSPRSDVDGPLIMNGTELVWKILEDYFGIDRYDVWQNSVYLYEHTEDILRGHPCALGGDNSNAGGIDSVGSGCTDDLHQNILRLSNFVHVRRTFTTNTTEQKMATMRKIKLEEVQQIRGIT